MLDTGGEFAGRVTFVTGPEKHCGKTTFMNRAAELARRACREAGLQPPALLTVGYDGEGRDFLSGARKPAVPLRAGDVFLTAERFLRPSGSAPEILDALPGSTALGRLAIARATRDGQAALVGPEGNSSVAWALARILEGGLSTTALVDGAINRITQAAGRPGARFAYVMRVDPANLDKSVARVRRLAFLASLPLANGARGDCASDDGACVLEGPLTAETAARLPRGARRVSVEDFTKVFLEWPELSAFARERELSVRTRVEFAGFSVACRNLRDGEFLDRLGDGPAAALVSFNPHETGAVTGGQA